MGYPYAPTGGGGGFYRISERLDWREDFLVFGSASAGGGGMWADGLPTGSGGKFVGEHMWILRASGGGAVNKSAPMAAGRHGVIYINTATSATGYSSLGISEQDEVFPGPGVSYEVGVQVPVLSAVAEEFIVRIGLSDYTGNADPTNGAFFKYDRLTSANWLLCNTDLTVPTVVDSGVPVTADWCRLRVEIADDGLSTEFYVDDESAGVVNSNVPTIAVGPWFQITKSAGVTARQLNIDWAHLYADYTDAPR